MTGEDAMDSVQVHPDWCAREHCTAFTACHKPYHRSGPHLIPLPCPELTYYVNLEANEDGSEPYVEVDCVDAADPSPWWDPDNLSAGLALRINEARTLVTVLQDLLLRVG